MRSLLLVSIAAMALPIAAPAVAKCSMTLAEQSWVDGSLKAWDHMSRERLRLAAVEPPTIIVFDDKCRFEASATIAPRGKGEEHSGRIRLPDGSDIPVGVASAASRDDKTGNSFFFMALPPIWEAAGIPISGDSNGLRGVFLHEFAHTRQTLALKPSFDAAAAVQPMPDIVAVQYVCMPAGCMELLLEQVRDGRLAGAGETRKPEYGRPLVLRDRALPLADV